MVPLKMESISKITLKCYYSKAKAEERELSNLCFFHSFKTFIPCSTTYFLEMASQVSLKVDTNCSFRGKATHRIKHF